MNKNQRRRANARRRRDAEARVVANHFEVKRIIRETDGAVLGGEEMPKVAPMGRNMSMAEYIKAKHDSALMRETFGCGSGRK